MYESYTDKSGKKLWRVRVCTKDENRKQHSRYKAGITSERKAKDLEYQFKKELEEKLSNGSIWNWKSWHEECLRRMRYTHKNGTIESYDGGLKKWLPKSWSDKSLTDFSTEDVYDWLFDHCSTVTPVLRRNIHRLVRRIFQMAVEEGIISRNPSIGIQVKVPRPRQRVLNSKEAERFLDYAMDAQHRFYPIWLFALKTGMRSGEMFALRWQDIDFELNLISVNKQYNRKDGLGPPKNRETRVVPIADDLRLILEKWKMEAKKTDLGLWEWADSAKTQKRRVVFDDPVLPHPRRWWSGEQAKVTREFCEVAGVSTVGFHDLRATFITNMLAQGVSLPKVMGIVGHRKTATTDEYLRLAGVDIAGSTNELGYKAPQEKEGALVLKFVPKGG